MSITHLVFGKEFTSAIEQKQVAQQEAERQTYVVAKAEQEKKAAIIRAEGEAEAAATISKALEQCGSGLIEVRRIDAAREVAETLSRARGVTYLPSGGDKGGSNMLLGLNTDRQWAAVARAAEGKDPWECASFVVRAFRSRHGRSVILL